MKTLKYVALLKKYNMLENKYQVLKEYTKNHCFDKLIDKIGEPLEIKRLKEENKRLRIKLKKTKEMYDPNYRVFIEKINSTQR